MKWIDTHTHLYDEVYENGGDDAVRRAIEAGVEKMILPGTSLSEFEPMKRLALRFPENLRMAIGLHPTELTDAPDEAMEAVKLELAAGHPYVAVGEIGVDLYCPGPPEDVQMQCFEKQCNMALEADLPIIIHCRDGMEQVLEVLRGLGSVPRGVFHCFGGTPADVERIRNVGDFYFGINGIVTFKNSSLRSTLPEIGLERILLETDAPYLSPVPYRGKRNESAWIPLIGAYIAEQLALTPEIVADSTTANANSLFKLN